MVYAKDPAIFQAQVPPLDVAQLMKALAQALCRWNRRRDHADRHWSCRRRGARRERPRGRRATEKRGELAAAAAPEATEAAATAMVLAAAKAVRDSA